MVDGISYDNDNYYHIFFLGDITCSANIVALDYTVGRVY